MNNAYALIMAGGAGTRLWPLSRKSRPKPLIPLVEQKRSMFQIAVDRLDPLIPPERILVVANRELTPQLQNQASQIPEENFIIEPSGRDTAPAVGLGAIHVHHRDPKAVMAVLTADHFIGDEKAFREALASAITLSAEGNVVTLGITPTHPSTGFGYIERATKAREVNSIKAFALAQFREKPDADTAQEYIKSGNYSWNSGMFIWPASRVISEFQQHAPDIHDHLNRLASVIGTPDYEPTLDIIWTAIRRVSVDYALLEHIDRDIYVIPVEMDWQDIGNFDTLYSILTEGSDENIVNTDEKAVLLDSTGTMIFSKRLVAAAGIEDLVIIDTDDVLLVCKRDRAQDVKKLVEILKEENRDRYL